MRKYVAFLWQKLRSKGNQYVSLTQPGLRMESGCLRARIELFFGYEGEFLT